MNIIYSHVINNYKKAIFKNKLKCSNIYVQILVDKNELNDGVYLTLLPFTSWTGYLV